MGVILRNCRLFRAALAGCMVLSTAGLPRAGTSGAEPGVPDGHSVTVGSYADRPPPSGPTLRLVSFNLHGPPTGRIDTTIEVLRRNPKVKDAAVLALQEVNRDHVGSGNRDVARELARALRVHFAYAIELEHPKGGVRGLAILSRYPLSNVERILLPVEGPSGRRRIALAATVGLGERLLRVYNVHLETKITAAERGEQIAEVIRNSAGFEDHSVVVLGDFNTAWSASKKVMFDLFQAAGFQCPLPGNRKTFQSRWVIRLELDWIWTRKLKVLESDVEEGIRVSDHRPVWADIDRDSILIGAPRGSECS